MTSIELKFVYKICVHLRIMYNRSFLNKLFLKVFDNWLIILKYFNDIINILFEISF